MLLHKVWVGCSSVELVECFPSMHKAHVQSPAPRKVSMAHACSISIWKIEQESQKFKVILRPHSKLEANWNIGAGEGSVPGMGRASQARRANSSTVCRARVPEVGRERRWLERVHE